MKRPRREFYVATALLSSLLSGIGAEMVLRYQCLLCTWTERNFGVYRSPYREPDDNTWYHLLKPNDISRYRVPEFDYEIRTNSLGIRDVEHPIEKPANEFRIIGLGDSFTEGQGALYEDSYLKVLEKNLNQRLEPVDVRIIVGGVSGSDPFYCYRLLEDRLLEFKSDLVTLAINNSDVTDAVARGGSERFLANGTVRFAEPPKDEWLFARSHLYRGFLMEAFDYDWFGLSPSQHDTKREEAIEKLEMILKEYRELARRENFRFLMILHPEAHELSARKYSFDAARLKRYCSENGISTLDLLDHFARRAGSQQELYWKNDFHHNAAGYRIFAEGIEEYLMDNGFVEIRNTTGPLTTSLS